MDLAKNFEKIDTLVQENLHKYKTVYKPKIEKFKQKYGKTSNLILATYAKKYVNDHNLQLNFKVQSFHFHPSRMVFATTEVRIYSNVPINEKIPVRFFPFLQIMIGPDFIRIGFSYGSLVEEDSDYVQRGREWTNELRKLFDYSQNDDKIIIESDGNPIKIVTFEELIKNWSNNIWIGKEIYQSDIDDTIEEKITETFDNLLEVFKITSLHINPVPPRYYWQISLGENATMWDEWKKNKIIAIGFKEVFQSAGEKILGMSEDEIKKLYKDAYPEDPNSEKETDNIINFLQKMKEGHYVLIDHGESDLGWGIIKSGPIYGYSQEFPVYRQIEWKNTAMQEPVTDDNME